MTRESFLYDLEMLSGRLVTMSAVVETQIEGSVETLEHLDATKAEQIAGGDTKVDEMRYQIEEDCLELMATQAPVAGDLRTLAAALIISNELERIGDYAEGICRLTAKMAIEAPVELPAEIPAMSSIAREMLHAVMQAFAARDAVAAQTVWERDTELDNLYQQLVHERLRHMISAPATVTQATYSLWVAHNLERIGDRVGNIAERVIFMVTGYLDRHVA